jgi:hypothetical protein
MNIRSFVGATSAVLLAWLGVTYFYDVPPERYQLDRAHSPTAAKSQTSEKAVANLETSDL